MSTAKKIEQLIKELGISDINFKDAGDGAKWKSSGTRYILYFTREGKRINWPIHAGAFDSESTLYFALKFKLAEKQNAPVCSDCGGRGFHYKAGPGGASTRTAPCHTCGGYKIA